MAFESDQHCSYSRLRHSGRQVGGPACAESQAGRGSKQSGCRRPDPLLSDVCLGMWVASQLLLLASYLGVLQAEFRILGAGPRNRSLVKEGDAAELSCSTSSNWFQCQWLSPTGEKSCAIRGSTGEICKGIPNARIGGNATTCSLTVNQVGPVGQQRPWTCVLQDSKDLATDRRSIMLRVGRKARVEVTVDEMEQEEKEAFGPLGWSTSKAIKKEGNRLWLKEGQQVDLHCQVKGANPPPRVEWMGPGPEPVARAFPQNGFLGDALGQAEGLLGSPPYDGQNSPQSQGWPQDVSLGPGSGGTMEHNKADETFSTTSTLTYTALAWHNNRSLTCQVTQVEEGTVVYTTAYTLFLMVDPLPVISLPTGPGGEVIGMIVGITIGSLLFIALIVILVYCLCRRRKGRKDGSEPGRVSNGAAVREQEQPPSAKPAGPGVWLRLTNSLRRDPASKTASAKPGKPQQAPRPSQARMVRTLSPIPGSVQSNSRPGSRTSQNLQGSRNSLASGSRHGSRTSVNTQMSSASVNMAPGQGVSMGQNMGEDTRANLGDNPGGNGRTSPSYSVDETEML